MAVAPEREEAAVVERGAGGPPRNGHGNGRGTGSGGGGQGAGGSGSEEPEGGVPARYLARRRSIWPFLLDLGVVLALFGWIITGQFLIVIGGVVAVVALFGWIREARSEYSRLAD